MGTKKRIYMGICSTGDRLDIHTFLFRDLQERYGDCIEMVFPDQCGHYFPHDFARCQHVDNFLASGCDALWFLDSDVSPPAFIFDLVKNQWDDWQVAGAPYPLFMNPPGSEEPSLLFTTYDGQCNDMGNGQKGIYMTECPPSGQKFVDAIATGCMFIKREVFDKLERPFFEFKFDPKTRKVIEGEDLGFCLKLNKLGIKCLIDYGMVCGHHKRVDLLKINNYAINMSNQKILAYDAEVRQMVDKAVAAAYAKGYEKALTEIKSDRKKMAKSIGMANKAGLILPSNYST